MDEILKDISNLRGKFSDTSKLLNEVSKISVNFPTSKKKKEKILEILVTKLIENIKSKNYENSIAISRLIFLSDLENQLIEVRKQGVFRTSKYNYNNKIIKAIINDLKNLNVFHLDDNDYIESILNLISMANDVRSEKEKIVATLKSKKNFFKTMLAFGELAFVELLYEEDIGEQDITQIKFSQNKESILESISLICKYYQELDMASDNDSGLIDKNPNKFFYRSVIFKAFKIRTFNEIEIKLDLFDYKANSLNHKNTIVIKNDIFELAKVHGYTKFNTRQDSLLKQFYLETKKSTVSLIEFYDMYWEKVHPKSPLYEVKDLLMKRIILRIPTFNETEKLGLNSVFREEAFLLYQTFMENYNQDLTKIEILKDVTVLDILKFQRAFFKVSRIYLKSLIDYGYDKDDLFEISLQSILPSFTLNDLITNASYLSGLNKEICQKIITHITVDMKGENEFIDIQYSPIVKLDKYYLVLPTVLSSSNLIRSIAFRNNIHLSSFGKMDFMIDELEKAFEAQGFKVKKDFEFGKNQTEIDLVVYKDKELFLFECKNPYHPTSDFELRNTYDHIKKAFLQVEKFKSIITDINLFKNFIRELNKFGFNINLNNVNVNYGIINANRALTGFSENDVRVYHANELVNFLNEGKFICYNVEYSSWEKEEFDVKDLLNYLNGNVCNDLWESFKPYHYSIEFRDKSIELHSFNLDYEIFKENIISKYKVTCDNILE